MSLLDTQPLSFMYADTIGATLYVRQLPDPEEAQDCRLWSYSCRETCPAVFRSAHLMLPVSLVSVAAADTVAGLGGFTSIFPVFPAIFEVLSSC